MNPDLLFDMNKMQQMSSCIFFFFNKEPNNKSTNVLMLKLHLILQSQQCFNETVLNCIMFQEWFLLHTFAKSVALLLD